MRWKNLEVSRLLPELASASSKGLAVSPYSIPEAYRIAYHGNKVFIEYRYFSPDREIEDVEVSSGISLSRGTNTKRIFKISFDMEVLQTVDSLECAIEGFLKESERLRKFRPSRERLASSVVLRGESQNLAHLVTS